MGMVRRQQGVLAAVAACALIIATLVGASTIASMLEAPKGQVEPISSPMGDYRGLAWLDDWLFVSYGETQTIYDGRIWQLRSDGSDMRMLDLAGYPGCERNGFMAPSKLPDGRLGYVVTCGRPNQDVWSLYMMAYDVTTGDAKPLLDYPLRTVAVGTGGYSWNPTMTRGIISDGDGRLLSERLYWLTPSHWEHLYLDFPVSYAGSWSPDGEQIAFMAGDGGWTADYNLYLMQPDGTNARLLAKDLHNAVSLAWSPDGNWIAYPHTERSLFSREDGLWVVNVRDGRRYLLARGNLFSPKWSPDGRQIAAILSAERGDSQDRLVLIDARSLFR